MMQTRQRLKGMGVDVAEMSDDEIQQIAAIARENSAMRRR